MRGRLALAAARREFDRRRDVAAATLLRRTYARAVTSPDAPGAPPGVRDELVRLLRAYAAEAERLGQVFAERNGMHPTDLQALLAVMQAEAAGAPLTPGRLGEHLGLSSGATTAVVDRLERAEHVLAGFTPDELAVVRRFLEQTNAAVRAHREEVTSAGGAGVTAAGAAASTDVAAR